MNITNTQCLLETWQPEPKKPLVGEIPVKEGKTLPNSVTEDVMGMALMPHYLIMPVCKKTITRQLRKSNRQQRSRKFKYLEFLMMNTITTGGSIKW